MAARSGWSVSLTEHCHAVTFPVGEVGGLGRWDHLGSTGEEAGYGFWEMAIVVCESRPPGFS